MKFIGRMADIGFAKETTRGTAVTTAAFWLPKLSMSYDDGVEQTVDESSLGIIEDATEAQVTGRFAVGELEGNIYDRSFGLLLLATQGAVSTSSPAETTVYTHTFTTAQSAQHQSLTVLLDDNNQDYNYALAMVENLDLDFAVGQMGKFTAGFRSRVGVTATNNPSYTVENRFLPQHINLQFATNLAGLSSPTVVNVTSAKISIKKNIEDDRRIGSVDQVDILNKQFAVEGSVEMVFDANTFKTQMLADTPLAVRLELINTDVTIGTTLTPRIRFTMPRVKFSEFTKNYENDGIVTATVSFKALYSVADSSMLTTELRNTQVSY